MHYDIISAYLTGKEENAMPDSPAKKKWLKENSKAITFRLMLKSDADIIEYLGTVPVAATIKAAVREYMANHSSAPSAAQPAEEEKPEVDYSWMFEDEEDELN